MKKFTLLLFLVSTYTLSAQIRTDVGVNLTPLLLNSLDVQAEWQVLRTFSIVGQTGLRYQTQAIDQPPRIGPLAEFMQPRNVGAYVGLAGRWFNPEVNEYQYPFVQLGFMASYYDEELLRIDGNGEFYRQAAAGVQFGITSTIGFVIRLTERANLDLALQMGYAPPREDVQIYYTAGMGYTTYGVDAISIPGAHLQPMITFKYNIQQSRRQRIYQQD